MAGTTDTTTYRLECAHRADVTGPHGATTGRAWCDTCDESRRVVVDTTYSGLDERDAAILAERTAAWQDREGPRVGDYVKVAGRVVARISHDWDEHGLQTSPGGSYYLTGSGHLRMSGSLNRALPRDRFEDTGDTRPGPVWFFHHDQPRAGNAVTVTIPCRVFQFTPEGPPMFDDPGGSRYCDRATCDRAATIHQAGRRWRCDSHVLDY